MTNRCEWVTEDPISINYHDHEWGNLEYFNDDRYLFEMLSLEGSQAGLSWMTILKRRQNYKEAFDDFDPSVVALYSEEKKRELINNSGIIRNKRKIDSVINNAQAFLKMKEEYGTFHEFLWQFFGGKQLKNKWEKQEDVPTSTEDSERLSKELYRRGFTFVGPIICYSFMQAVGLVNDHTIHCFLSEKGRN